MYILLLYMTIGTPYSDKNNVISKKLKTSILRGKDNYLLAIYG
jgi:hypothetical protein